MRFCSRCNRPLHDERYHDVVTRGNAAPPIAGWYYGNPVFDVPEGDLSPRFRKYVCKVRLIADSPTSGKRYVPKTPQRINNDARYVQEELLNG